MCVGGKMVFAVKTKTSEPPPREDPILSTLRPEELDGKAFEAFDDLRACFPLGKYDPNVGRAIAEELKVYEKVKGAWEAFLDHSEDGETIREVIESDPTLNTYLMRSKCGAYMRAASYLCAHTS